MGFVVLVLSQVIQQLCGMPLLAVVVTVGAVTTLYTMLGGLRMVIWADVVQVAILVTGAAGTIALHPVDDGRHTGSSGSRRPRRICSPAGSQRPFRCSVGTRRCESLW